MFDWLRRGKQSRKRQRRTRDLAREAHDLREHGGGDRRPLGGWVDLITRDALTGPTRRLPTVPLRGREPRPLAPAPAEPVVVFRDDANRAINATPLVRPYTSHRLPD